MSNEEVITRDAVNRALLCKISAEVVWSCDKERRPGEFSDVSED